MIRRACSAEAIEETFFRPRSATAKIFIRNCGSKLNKASAAAALLYRASWCGLGLRWGGSGLLALHLGEAGGSIGNGAVRARLGEAALWGVPLFEVLLGTLTDTSGLLPFALWLMSLCTRLRGGPSAVPSQEQDCMTKSFGKSGSRNVATMQNFSFLLSSLIALKVRSGVKLGRLAGRSERSNAPAAGGMKRRCGSGMGDTLRHWHLTPTQYL
mmetsp:Transcript_8802/g.15825  ORF Transcript_8802/g.15825 Transcript_8802/m.15825 type:complete len:213 (+) Transcript_8802:328-966(+)